MPQSQPYGQKELQIKADPSGATGSTTWSASEIFADVLRARVLRTKHTILELGCGAGYMAMRLATVARGTRVIATDVPSVMRNLKFNVNRNQLRHAVCEPNPTRDGPPDASLGNRLHTLLRKPRKPRMPKLFGMRCMSVASWPGPAS